MYTPPRVMKFKKSFSYRNEIATALHYFPSESLDRMKIEMECGRADSLMLKLGSQYSNPAPFPSVRGGSWGAYMGKKSEARRESGTFYVNARPRARRIPRGARN